MRSEFDIILPFCKGVVNWQLNGTPVEIRITDGKLFKAMRKSAPKVFTQNAMAYALGVNTHNLSQFEIGNGKIRSIPFNPLMIDEYMLRVREYHCKGIEYFKENKKEITHPERIPNNKFVTVDENKFISINENCSNNRVKLYEEEEQLLSNMLAEAQKYIDEFEQTNLEEYNNDSNVSC